MSIIEDVRAHIFKAVDSVTPQSGYKTLVIDHRCKSIIDSCMDSHELLDRKVANVLILDAQRASEPYLEAVYICEATQYNIDCIASDYTVRPARYNKAHVFLLSGATKKQINALKNSAAQHFLESVRLAPFNFVPLQKRVFTFGDRYAMERVYNLHLARDPTYIEKMAVQIADVCATLGETPHVRYYASKAQYQQSQLTKVLAEKVDSFLEGDQSSPAPRNTLLILDRSVDLSAAMLHDVYFEGMAYDLTDIDDLNVYRSNDKSLKERLSESDAVWTELRDQHISIVIEELQQRMHQLRSANPNFESAANDINVRDVRNMIAALPEYVKSKDRIALNLQLAAECMDEFKRRKLDAIIQTEQSILLGNEKDGDTNEPVQDQLIKLLADEQIEKGDKLRLLMLYVLSRDSGLFKEDYERLKAHAKLSRENINMILNLDSLGLPTLKEPDHVRESGLCQMYSESQEQNLLFARAEPALRQIISHLIKGTLCTTTFPYIGPIPETQQASLDQQNTLRNQRQRATWARSSHGQSRNRVLIFIVGGMTGSEIRAANMASEGRCDVLLGGNQILTPEKMLKFLSRQRTAVEELAFEQHKQKKIPSYLLANQSSSRIAGSSNSGTAPPNPASTASGNQNQNQNQNQNLPQMENLEIKSKRKIFGFRRK